MNQPPGIPPLIRRLAGSSAIEASRELPVAPCGTTNASCPLAPRNAPVPPVIVRVPSPGGRPGAGGPPAIPFDVMLPTDALRRREYRSVHQRRRLVLGYRLSLARLGH